MYSCTMLVKTMTGGVGTACGSFGNIAVDGRLSMANAIDVARETFKKEAAFNRSEYMGFAIEKVSRFVDYKRPRIVDNDTKPDQIFGLL